MPGVAAGDRTLQQSPTWAIAVVCAVFLILSLVIERGIHAIEKWFQKRRKKAMIEALEKIKAELMLLGFISLLLTGCTRSVAKLCIPAKLDTMLPCKAGDFKEDQQPDDDHAKRKLLSYAEDLVWRRVLAGSAVDDHCAKHGKVPLISPSALHQLHNFIFLLTVMHVLYSVITMALARAKMNKWKAWELETSSLEYQYTNDPARFRLTHQTTFVRHHSGFSSKPWIKWIVAFCRQFFRSVSKVDYLTMRHGFINAHFAPNSTFNFHKYIKRSMEDDFKVVVGISIPLWIFALIFLLLSVHKWQTLRWLSLAPLIILLGVGSKLELIIIEMAQEIQDRTTVVAGAPVVQPSDKYFWFNRPHWILYLIHFTMFQNAFQMAYFLVNLYAQFEFGMSQCFKEDLYATLTRVLLGVALLILCSYVTFPLYALVTQMGSHMKRTIFEDQTAKALQKWQHAAKERRKLRNAAELESLPGSVGGENKSSRGTSPLNLQQKYQPSQPDSETVLSFPRSLESDTEISEMEDSTQERHESKRRDQPVGNEESHSIDFSFLKG